MTTKILPRAQTSGGTRAGGGVFCRWHSPKGSEESSHFCQFTGGGEESRRDGFEGFLSESLATQSRHTRTQPGRELQGKSEKPSQIVLIPNAKQDFFYLFIYFWSCLEFP